jgi:hypothetical protein
LVTLTDHFTLITRTLISICLLVVLLFETNAGWNQFGGPEILVTERHEPKGCNVLLNDGQIRFVTEDQLSTLKW